MITEQEKVERQQERAADFHEAEAARLREKIAARPEPGLLEPPYAQVIGRNSAVLLTPEQIDFILYAMQDYGVTHGEARRVEGEMWRAKNAVVAAAADNPEIELPEGWIEAE